MAQEIEVKSSSPSWALDAISQVCSQMGSPPDGFTASISSIIRRPAAKVSLWKSVDVKDFSTAKFFIVPDGDINAVFLVDFLSRHEIVPPMSNEKLPLGWDEWGVIKGNNILVCNKSVFLQRLMTPDAFLALPPHRFESLADDIEHIVYDGNSTIDAVKQALSRGGTGYSFVLFARENPCRMEVSMVWSCLNGEIYENSNLLGSTPQQFELWTH